MTSQDVDFHLEAMLPEMNDMVERGIFTDKEAKVIIQRRTTFEYSIHRNNTLLADFLRYIAYETGLEELRKKRKLRLRLDTKERGITLSDHSLVRRIHSLYQKALQKFKSSIQTWTVYLQWAESVNSSRAIGKIIAKAIQLHPTKQIFWILGARWELKQNSITGARVLLQRGLRMNSGEKELWLTMFSTELEWVTKLKERRKILFKEEESLKTAHAGMEIDDDELEREGTVLRELGALSKEVDEEVVKSGYEDLNQLLIPQAIFRNAIKAIPNNLNFCLSFLQLYNTFGDCEIAVDEVYKALEFFGDEALRTICERDIAGLTVSDPKYPAALGRVCSNYMDRKASTYLYTSFIDFLSSLIIEERNLKEFIDTITEETLVKAESENLLNIYLYNFWYQRSKNRNILERGLRKFSDSKVLWLETIKVTKKSEIASKFERAVETCDVWVEYLRWSSENQNNEQIENIFLKAPRTEINERLFLQWTYLNRNEQFEALMKRFERNTIPFYRFILDLVKVKDQDLVWMKIHSLEPKDAALWLEEITALVSRKEVKKAEMVYWRASRAVVDLADLQLKYQLIQN